MSGEDVVRVEVFDDLELGVGVVEGVIPDGYDEREADIYADAFEDGVIATLNYYRPASED